MPRRKTNERRESSAAHFANLLADILHQLHVTHQELANRLGVKRYTVDSWTRATNPSLPSADNLERLCLWLEARQPGLSRQLVVAAANALPVQTPILGGESHGKLRAAETNFIGREAALAIIQGLLRQHRLVTLTGAGGIGKTRLALRVSEAVFLDFEDGVYVTELASLSHPGLLAHAIGAVLRLYEGAGITMQQVVTDALRTRHTLLVLDNCEHLLAACAELCQHLLDACPRLTILATSRERLHLAAEVVWDVPPLTFPTAGVTRTRRQLMAEEAPRLFAQRALWARRGLDWSREEVELVCDICRRLDGIPLAVEMAAAWMGSLPLGEIAERLNLEFLVAPEPGGLPRHRTMRAVIDWSYRLLNAAEQTLLARLAIFPGGWTAEAALAVCVALPPDESAPPTKLPYLLQTLVHKSLVLAEADQDRHVRYRMLEITRQFAWERLAVSGNVAQLRQRQVAYYRAKCEEAEAAMRGKQSALWLGWFAQERDNLRVTIEWALSEPAHRGHGVWLAAAMETFWWMRGEYSEGRQLLAPLATDLTLPPPVRTRLLRTLGVLCWGQGDLAQAQPLLQEAAQLALDHGDQRSAAWSLLHLMSVFLQLGEYDRVQQTAEQAEPLFYQAEDGVGIGMTLVARASAQLGAGRNDEAGALIRRAHPILVAEEDSIGIAECLTVWGNIDDLNGDFAAAQGHYEAALPHLQAVDNRLGVSHIMNNLGVLAYRQAAYAQAAEHFLASAELDGEIGHLWWRAFKLLNLGAAAARLGDTQQAATHLKSSLAYFATRDDPHSRKKVSETLLSLAKLANAPGLSVTLLAASAAIFAATGFGAQAVDEAEFEENLATFRAQLSEAAFNTAWDRGSALTIEETVALALSIDGQGARAEATPV